MKVRAASLRIASLTILVALLAGAGATAAPRAPLPDCEAEATELTKDEADLPHIEVVTPRDRPPYCITLETVMEFAARLKAHVAHCSNSNYASAAADWEKTRSDFAKRFVQTRCKRTLIN